MTGISDYARMSTLFVSGVQAVPRETGAFFNVLHTLLYRSIDASFVDFVLVFTFHYETKAKVKCILSKRERQLRGTRKSRR